MKITILGSGGPISDGKRTSSSVLIEAANLYFLIDCGPGTGLRLAQSGVSATSLNMIFLTHLHMDHSLELPSIIFSSYLAGRDGPFDIYGPPGTQHFADVMFGDLFKYLPILVQNVAKKEMIVRVHEIGVEKIKLNEDASIESGEAKHGSVVAYTYKISEGSKTAVISGDTEPCDTVVNFAKNSSILIHDCAFPEDMGTAPGHTLPSQLSKIAKESSTKKVVLTHLFPSTEGKLDDMIRSVKGLYNGEVQVANDLDSFVI